MHNLNAYNKTLAADPSVFLSQSDFLRHLFLLLNI